MKLLPKCLGATVTAAIAYLLSGITPVKAATFAFSLEMGTANPADVNYGLGRHLFSGTFSGEDKNNNNGFDIGELSSFQASWGNFSFDLDDLVGLWVSKEKQNTVLVQWMELAQGELRLDYKKFGPLYQQFRVYICPPTLDCSKVGSIDYALTDGRVSHDDLWGFENHFVPGIYAYLTSNNPNPDPDPDPDPDPNPTPSQSVPEPSLLGGLLLLTFAGLGKRRQKSID